MFNLKANEFKIKRRVYDSNTDGQGWTTSHHIHVSKLASLTH